MQAIETAIATQEGSSAESFASPGYGNLKPLGELWGDVLAETGALQSSFREMAKASDAYETALSWYPDHAEAIVGLSAILLDSYEAASAAANIKDTTTSDEADPKKPATGTPTLASLPVLPDRASSTAAHTISASTSSTQPNLTALSARDRAYQLLSHLDQIWSRVG